MAACVQFRRVMHAQLRCPKNQTTVRRQDCEFYSLGPRSGLLLRRRRRTEITTSVRSDTHNACGKAGFPNEFLESTWPQANNL